MAGPGAPNLGGMNQAAVQGLFQKWMYVVQHPSAAVYESEVPQANWNAVIIAIVVVAVARLIAGILGGLLSGTLTAGAVGFNTSFLLGGGVGIVSGIVSAILSPVWFFLGALILWLSAKIFGGRDNNDFLTHSYLLSLSYGPLRGLGYLVSFIPIIGGLISFVLSLYQIYHAGLSMQVTQGLAPGKAQWAAWLPTIIEIVLVILFAVCALVLGLAFFTAVINGSR